MIRDEENKSSSNNVDRDEDIKKYNFAVKIREEKFLLMFDTLWFEMILIILVHRNSIKLVIFYEFPLLIETCQYPGNFLLLDNS